MEPLIGVNYQARIMRRCERTFCIIVGLETMFALCVNDHIAGTFYTRSGPSPLLEFTQKYKHGLNGSFDPNIS